MSVTSFRSVGWVAGIAATALGCYMVNLKVASERASLEDVETRIVLAQRDIRLLQTEIGTRGRLAQLEQWNVKVLALSAPKANQFLEGSFQLATLTAPRKVIDPAAPVVLASAPAPVRSQPAVDQDGPALTQPAPVQLHSTAPTDLLHVASLKRDLPEPAPRKVVVKPAPRRIATPAPAPRTASLRPDSKVRTTATAVPAVKVTPKPKPKPVAATTTTSPKAAAPTAPKPKVALSTVKPKPEPQPEPKPKSKSKPTPATPTKTKEAGTKR